jgi:hypothetical protein
VTRLVRQHAFVAAAEGQDIVPAKASNHFLPQISRNLLRALVPEENLLVTVHEIDPRLEVLQNHAKYLGTFQFGHKGTH